MKKKTTLYLSITSVILMIFIAIGCYVLVSEPSISVPKFVDQNVSVVEAWMNKNKIEESQVIYDYQYNEEIAKDVVIAQSIAADENFEDLLRLTISDGPDPDLKIDLIDFTNLSEDDIRNFFETNKFTDVTYEYTPDETISKGIFIKININEMTVSRSDLIVITLSAGSVKNGIEITMPDLKDKSKSEIDAWAKINYITINYIYVYSDQHESGKVVTYDPAVDSNIKTGSSVNVSVSLGKGITLNNLVGKSFDDASLWMKEQGLKVEKIEVYSSSTKGNVIAMDPSQGKIISTGSTVKLQVSVGLIPVDNYVGKNKSGFDTWLNNINLKYSKSANLKVSTSEVESDLDAGLIVSMAFDGSTYTSSNENTKYAQPSDTITLKISKGPSINVESKVGSKESDFLSYINKLGLNVVKGTSIYSTNTAKGNVVKHDTGKFAKGSTINYQLSLGAYAPSASTFDGQTVSWITSTLNAANGIGANNWSFKKTEDAYSDIVASGLSFNCSISGTVVSCKISKGVEPKPIEVVSYAGQSEALFKAFIANNDLLLGTSSKEYHDSIPAGSIISNTTGSFEKGTKINYVVSLGKKVTEASIIDLSLKIDGYSDPNSSKTVIEDYLKSCGFTNVNVTIVDSEYTKATLVPGYPPSGTYSLDYAFNIQISNGQG